MNGLKAWSLMRLELPSPPLSAPAQKKKRGGLCLYGRLFLCTNIVIDPETLELTI